MSLLALLQFTAGAAYAQTPQVERLDITDYGIYTLDREIKGKDARGIKLATATNIHHAETKRTIPAQIGTSFGFRYNVIGKPDGAAVNLRKIIVFPPPGLQPSPSKRVPQDEFAVEARIGQTNTELYTLEDSFELVRGTWVIEIWHGNRKLATQSFILEKPDTTAKPDTAGKPDTAKKPDTVEKPDREKPSTDAPRQGEGL
jgi:hypothetical protein